MTRKGIPTPSPTRNALKVLGNQIRTARLERRWTIKDLAMRVGIAEKTLSALESGSPTVSIGNVFNAALAVNVQLFGLEGPALALARRQGEEKLALLPERARKPRETSRNDIYF